MANRYKEFKHLNLPAIEKETLETVDGRQHGSEAAHVGSAIALRLAG